MISPVVAWLITMVGFWVVNSISKFVLEEVWPIRTIFRRTLCEFFFILGIMLIFWEPTWSIENKDIWMMIMTAVLWYLPFLSFQFALQRGDVGIIAPVGNSSLLFAAPFAYLILWETLSRIWVTWILGVVVWLILLTVNFASLKSSTLFSFKHGVPFALWASMGWGLVFILLAISARELGPLMTTFILLSVNFLCSSLLMMSKDENTQIPSKRSSMIVALVAVCSLSWVFAYNIGVAGAETYVVSALWFSSPIVAVIIGYLFFKERLTLQQVLGLVLMISCLIIINSFW